MTPSTFARARIILLRLVNEHTLHVIERLSTVLPACEDDLARPVVLVIEEARYRARYLPIGEP